MIREDFRRLWATGFLDDLSIEAHDYTFANGVEGKVIVFNIEERQRVRIVDYEGLVKVDQSAIEERLKDKSIALRLDSFLDPAAIERVASVVRELYAEKGYQYAEVTPEVKPVAGEAKLVHVSFNVVEGPKVAIRDVEFLGNRDVPDDVLAKMLKENRARGAADVHRRQGRLQGGQVRARTPRASSTSTAIAATSTRRSGSRSSKCSTTPATAGRAGCRCACRSPKGRRFVVGEVTFDGNTIVTAEALRQLFKLKTGEVYSQKDIRKGLETARDVYGAGGYFEFTGVPGSEAAQPPRSGDARASRASEPIVDVTIRVDEGKQYFVNRITFVGNTHTRDPVIRRELALVEAGVFNTAGAEEQHPAAQSARLLQADRGRRRERREDAGRGQQGRRRAEGRRAEPQPDQLRRRRLAVRGVLRQRLVHDVATSSAAARA